MATKIGINGFGRIGRQVFKAILERHPSDLEVVAVNDLADSHTNAHLLKYDTNYGRFPGTVEVSDGNLVVNERAVRVFSERDPAQIPWGEVGAEMVIESTGIFTQAEKAAAHIHDTVRKVVISAPATGEDLTIVLGVNEDKYDPSAAQRALQRVLHHKLRRANGQGAPRVLWHREGADVHRARLHQ